LKIDDNTKITNGDMLFRRFAYFSKTDASQFGVLEASNMADARRHLGSKFHIRVIWLNADEESSLLDRERRWEIVGYAFRSYPEYQDFIRNKNASKPSNQSSQSNGLHVVEYSREQKWFRVDGLEKVLIKNNQLLQQKIHSDFVILFVGSQADCWSACDQIEERFRQSDGRIPEAAHQPATDSHEIKRLRKRVIELESQLEAMTGYPYSDAPDTTGTEGFKSMALLASGRERKQDPDSSERERGEVK
jgi:hypothetical protein